MEVWKDIEGYEGKYQISNKGRVKSVKRVTTFKDSSRIRNEDESIRKLQEHHKGYFKVQLRKDNKTKSFFVHRLVAQAFIPNPENKQTVNHKDGNKKNNCIENLEWMTNQENMKHAYDNGIRNNDKVSKAKYKKVAQYTKNGEFVKEYESVKQACELTGFRQSGISGCCLGTYKTSNGYVWKYI